MSCSFNVLCRVNTAISLPAMVTRRNIHNWDYHTNHLHYVTLLSHYSEYIPCCLMQKPTSWLGLWIRSYCELRRPLSADIASFSPPAGYSTSPCRLIAMHRVLSGFVISQRPTSSNVRLHRLGQSLWSVHILVPLGRFKCRYKPRRFIISPDAAGSEVQTNPNRDFRLPQ